MSWFYYGEDLDNPIKHHKKRKGVWVRKYSNNDINELIKKTKNKRLFESVSRIVVDSYDKVNNVLLLQVWCQNIFDPIRKKHRYNVFYIMTEPNSKWVCEGDLGKGLID